MPTNFDIVVSAENNYYSAWQAMLFHYSCCQYGGMVPIIVVHGDDQPLLPGFHAIQHKGGRVQRARNFRFEGGIDYPPRNTAGTLSCVESDAEFLVICDPDIIFFKPLPLDQYVLKSDRVSFDTVSYLYVLNDNRQELASVCRRAGIPLGRIQEKPISGGVPHIVPSPLRDAVSREWLRCMDFFEPTNSADQDKPEISWVATMWALVLAVHRLNLTAIMTRFCLNNFEGRSPFDLSSSPETLLHYCYGDDEFDKRAFVTAKDVSEHVWRAEAAPGSLNAALCAQLHEAGNYYGGLAGTDRAADIVTR